MLFSRRESNFVGYFKQAIGRSSLPLKGFRGGDRPDCPLPDPPQGRLMSLTTVGMLSTIALLYRRTRYITCNVAITASDW